MTAYWFLQLRINSKLRLKLYTPKSAFHLFLHILSGQQPCLPRNVSWRGGSQLQYPFLSTSLAIEPFGSTFSTSVDSVCSSVSFLPTDHHQLPTRTLWYILRWSRYYPFFSSSIFSSSPTYCWKDVREI